MTLVKQYLWSDVFRSPADSVSSFRDYLGKPEIDKFKKPVAAYHDIFWLKISIDYILALQIFKNAHHLRSIKCSLFWVEVTDRSVMCKKISTSEQLCDKVYVPLILHEAIVIHLNTY